MVGRPARTPDRMTVEKSAERRSRCAAGNTSGRQLRATLAAAGGQDRATGPGTHPQPETVGFRPTPVVGLESSLAQRRLHSAGPLAAGLRHNRCRPPPHGRNHRVRGHGATAGNGDTPRYGQVRGRVKPQDAPRHPTTCWLRTFSRALAQIAGAGYRLATHSPGPVGPRHPRLVAPPPDGVASGGQ